MIRVISWSKKLSVGIREIDDQHKHFIGILNNVQESLVKKKTKEELESILNDLVEYARIHFSTEEEYFKKWNYPYATEHNKEHEKLLLKVLEFKDDFEDRGVEIVGDLLNFLKNWLVNHLQKYDFKYAKYFKDKKLI